MSDQIRSLADLRPGDIMFGPIGGLVPGVVPVGLGQLALGEVFRVGRLSVRHVGIVVQAADYDAMPGKDYLPRLVQAMPGGAEEIELTSEHWTPRHAYLRLPEDYPGQADDAAAIARLFVREQVAYSFLSYVALAAWRFGLRADRLAKWINRRGRLLPGPRMPFRLDARSPEFVQLPVEAICSVLVDQAWTLAGKDVMPNTAEQAVTPGALANQLWRTPGAIWGLPGSL